MATDELSRARTLARVLDSIVPVPGTSFRFGLDPILGLIPGLGDVAGAALSGYMVLLASRRGAPKTVIARMVANVAIDAAVGAVPVLGDLFDASWKSNTRNLALLEKTLGGPPGVQTQHQNKLVLAGALLGLLALAVAGFFVALLVFKALVALYVVLTT